MPKPKRWSFIMGKLGGFNKREIVFNFSKSKEKRFK